MNRGPGSVAPTWGEESSDQGVNFEPLVLPLNSPELRDSLLFGVGSSVPEVNAQGEAAGTAATSASSGEAVERRRLSPRHRRAVRTFFGGEREDR